MSKSTGQGKGEGEGKGILSKLRGKGRKRSKSKPLQHHIPGIPRPRSPSTTAPYTVLDQSIVTAAAANSTASTNASRADRGDDSSSAPGPSRPSQTQTQTRSPSRLVSRYVPTTPSSSLPSALATSSSFPSQAQAVGFRVVGVEPKLSSLQNTISQDPKLERMVQILPAAAGSVLEGDNDQLCVVIDDGEDKSAKAPRMSRTLDVIVCPSVWTGSGIRSLLSALNQIKHTRAVQRVYVHTLQELFAHLDQKKDERKLSERRQRGGSVSTLKSPGFVAPSHVNQLARKLVGTLLGDESGMFQLGSLSGVDSLIHCTSVDDEDLMSSTLENHFDLRAAMLQDGDQCP